MTADKQSAAPPVEREKFEAAMREQGIEPELWLAHKPEAGYANPRVCDYWFGWMARSAASPPIPAGQTLSAQPVASKELSDADRKLLEQLKQQAQIHAQEARTANATIAEIYQLVTGATGEPGNWNGAEPVRQALARIRAQALEEAAKACEKSQGGDGRAESRSSTAKRCAAAIRALALPSIPGEKP